jgi:hypothetical protein
MEMTGTLVTTPDTWDVVTEEVVWDAAEPAVGSPGTPAPDQRAMRVVLGPGVVEHVRNQGEEAISLELTLEFEGLVVKHAVAYPGASEPAFGFSRLRVDGIDVWWRQRLVVAGRNPAVTTAIRPRQVVVGRVGRALSAVATYA